MRDLPHVRAVDLADEDRARRVAAVEVAAKCELAVLPRSRRGGIPRDRAGVDDRVCQLSCADAQRRRYRAATERPPRYGKCSSSASSDQQFLERVETLVVTFG